MTPPAAGAGAAGDGAGTTGEFEATWPSTGEPSGGGGVTFSTVVVVSAGIFTCEYE